MYKEIVNPFKNGFSRNLFFTIFISLIVVFIFIFINDVIFKYDFVNITDNFDFIYYFIFTIFLIVFFRKYDIDFNSFFTKPLFESFSKLIKEIYIVLPYATFTLIYAFYSIFMYKHLPKYQNFNFLSDKQEFFYLVSIWNYELMLKNIKLFIVYVVFAPIMEEIVFRGLLFTRLTVKLNIKDAMLLSSLIFGILHGDSFLSISILGYIFALIYLRTSSLIYPIIAHGTYNFFILLVYSFLDSKFFLTTTILLLLIYALIIVLTLISLNKFANDSFSKIKNLTEAPYFENYRKNYPLDNITFVEQDIEGQKKNNTFKFVIVFFVLSIIFTLSIDYYYNNKNYTIAEKRVNEYTKGDQKKPSSAIYIREIFTAWQSEGQDGDSWGIYGKAFNIDSKNLVNEKGLKDILINETTSGKQENPNVKTIGERFLVTWNGKGKSDDEGIYARYFDLKGKPLSHEFRVNDVISGIQTKPIILLSRVRCTCSFFILWKNEAKSRISIKQYSIEDFSELEEEIEIEIPKEVNFKTLKFDVSETGKIFLVGKVGKKTNLYSLDYNDYSLSKPIEVTDKGYNPNISISEEQKLFVSWEETDLDNNYMIMAKEYDTNLKEKFGKNTNLATTSISRLKKPQTYYIDEALISFYESEDFSLENGFIFGFLKAILDNLTEKVNLGVQVNYKKSFFQKDWQINNYAKNEQSNISIDYIFEDDDDKLFLIISSWQSFNQDGDKFGIYVKMLSFEENELVEFLE